MGCVVSNPVASGEEKELPQFVSGEDIQLVQESWLLVQPDLEDIGVIILNRFGDFVLWNISVLGFSADF